MCKVLLTSILVLLFGVNLANAAVIELPLACAGDYDSNTPDWTTDFDLGVSFTEITNVYIDWSGEITGGLVTRIRDPEPSPADVLIHASLGSNPTPRYANVWGGEATYPAPELFGGVSQFELSGSDSWSDLLDGQGTILIKYQELIIIDGSYVEFGSVTLDQATLIVQGTLVPEPMTLCFLAMGVLALRRGKKH